MSISAKCPLFEQIKTKCDVHLKAIVQTEFISMGPLCIAAVYPPGLVTFESANIISLSLCFLIASTHSKHVQLETVKINFMFKNGQISPFKLVSFHVFASL